ncbi:MAG: hypothetical protein PHU98_14105 [Mariniphaga sp.]|nr:hypothetical protein [Mariniphaga sp.]
MMDLRQAYQSIFLTVNEKISPQFSTAAFILLLFFPFFASAQGDLLITPRRVVFEGNRQRQEITLANTGQDTATYSVSFVQYHMTEEGSFEVVTEPKEGQLFADSYLRFFPRTVTLAPNESQIVRMQVRRMPGMEDGEYRSHVYFRAVPVERPLGEEELQRDSAAIGVRLTPIFGITIPVIIRVGDTSAKVTLSDLNIVEDEDKNKQLKITFLREGNQSVYGDVEVIHQGPDETETPVGTVRGIAVYTPNTIRKFTLPLTVPEGVDISGGKLTVRYSSSNDAKPEIFDEQVIQVP